MALPPNDDLAWAIDVSSPPFTDRQDISDATFDTNEVLSQCQWDALTEKGVWYRLAVDTAQGLVIDTEGSTAVRGVGTARHSALVVVPVQHWTRRAQGLPPPPPARL